MLPSSDSTLADLSEMVIKVNSKVNGQIRLGISLEQFLWSKHHTATDCPVQFTHNIKPLMLDRIIPYTRLQLQGSCLQSAFKLLCIRLEN